MLKDLGIGDRAEKAKEVAQLVDSAFSYHGRLWRKWTDNLSKLRKPDAALRIAELVLAECEWNEPNGRKGRLFGASAERSRSQMHSSGAPQSRMLLCDFHIHTNYSDGKLSVSEVVDFYGHLGFDCICITDHLADPNRLIGKLTRLSNLTLGTNQLSEYFDVIERERHRAWRKYQMLVLTGIEFNKDGLTSKSSTHLLGIDLKGPIDPTLDLPELIQEIHSHGGLVVASHPHKWKSVWGKNTLYLWENQDRFCGLIDAWEIANRDDIFNPVGLKRMPFIANSDFHKPKHIFSWKTLLHCPKDPEAIKDCIRRNQNVAITLYREVHLQESVNRGCFSKVEPPGSIVYLQQTLPLKSVNG